jgi:SAM-dependent methyltransferase
MLRQVIDTATHTAAWLRRGRTVHPSGAIVKVNLGSGLKVAPGWVNLDSSLNALCAQAPPPVLRAMYPLTNAKQWYSRDAYVRLLRENTFVHHDFTYGLPFPDRSVDYVYSSHLVEHLFKDEAERLMRESFRILKPSGRIRVCVPDLEHAVSLYQAGQRETAMEFFFSDSKRGYFGRHQYMYDFQMLSELLAGAGFDNIQRCAFREGQMPDIAVLDNRPEQTLYVEAVRPA